MDASTSTSKAESIARYASILSQAQIVAVTTEQIAGVVDLAGLDAVRALDYRLLTDDEAGGVMADVLDELSSTSRNDDHAVVRLRDVAALQRVLEAPVPRLSDSGERS